MARRKIFRLVLIKPSHYDDNGYVIQWVRSAIPSNSLASLHALATDCAARRILGADVDLEIEVHDETNTRIRPGRVARRVLDADGGVVGLSACSRTSTGATGLLDCRGNGRLCSTQYT